MVLESAVATFGDGNASGRGGNGGGGGGGVYYDPYISKAAIHLRFLFHSLILYGIFITGWNVFFFLRAMSFSRENVSCHCVYMCVFFLHMYYVCYFIQLLTLFF